MIYYISDTHFGHAKVIEMDNRPFRDVEHMERTMIENWNRRVTNSDTVCILGDFCWGKKNEWIRILSQLKGQKVLIRGNHDLRQYPPELKVFFADICDYKEIVDNGNDNGHRKVMMSHYPSPFYKHAGNGHYFMLTGHVHQTFENDLLNKILLMARAKDQGKANRGQVINVGCMMPYMDYTPRTLQEIIPAWEAYQTKVSMDLIRNAESEAERNYFASLHDANLQRRQREWRESSETGQNA